MPAPVKNPLGDRVVAEAGKEMWRPEYITPYDLMLDNAVDIEKTRENLPKKDPAAPSNRKKITADCLQGAA